MPHIPDPDSSSEEDSISVTSTPKDRNFFYEEDIFEESQDETTVQQPIYLEESVSESMEYAEDELESMSRETPPRHSLSTESSQHSLDPHSQNAKKHE
jgi:hypothetical protein